MARTTKDDVILRELFDEAVQGAFAQKKALMGSALAAMGAAIVAGDMPESRGGINQTINVPYFSVIGDFENISTDGNPLTPKKISEMKEQATVQHDGLSFEVTRWARSSEGRDVYEEGAAQVMEATERQMDSLLITKAATTPLVSDVFDANNPKLLDYPTIVDARVKYGDEQDGIVGMVVHSQTHANLSKLVDGNGRPLLLPSANEGGLDRFAGIPLTMSDRLPIDGSSMSAITATGTTPPTVTISGTPLGKWSLQIDIVVGGALATATFRFSTDGGQTWSATMATAASVPLIDTAVDSLVGVNGATGITAVFNSGTYNADNLYTATATLKHTSLILKARSLAFWYNREALKLQTDRDILRDTDVAAIHLYSAPHMYRRVRGSTKPGVVKIRHN